MEIGEILCNNLQYLRNFSKFFIQLPDTSQCRQNIQNFQIVIKDRIMEIEDPDKQRKMEESLARKDKKRNQPKMKQLKMKAM